MQELKQGSKKYLADLLSFHPQIMPLKNNILSAISLLLECSRSGGTIFVCGNGGSAADSEHIVGELMKSFMKKRPMPTSEQDKFRALTNDNADYLINTLEGGIRAISLVSGVSLPTALANDTSADIIFAQQLYGLAKKDDILLAISTSGNAQNVVNALHVAKVIGCKSIGLTGKTGGKMAPLLDVEIRAPHDSTPIIQEMHLPMYHCICAVLEEELF